MSLGVVQLFRSLLIRLLGRLTLLQRMKLYLPTSLTLFLFLPFGHKMKSAHANALAPVAKIETQSSVPAHHKTKFLFVVTTDGLRWQEVFGGADSSLLFDRAFVSDIPSCSKQFWAASREARCARLFPFLWGQLAQKGQIYGNRYVGNCVNTANRMWFSYPGYNEMFSGRPDDQRIFTNNKWSNPNETVFEFLNRQPEFKDKIALFATWDAFSAIFREKKSGLQVFCGEETNQSDTLPPDTHTWATALRHIKEQRPSIVYIGLDDTDAQAHKGHYDGYLEAAHRFDRQLENLWAYIQTDSLYKDQTTLLLTTDHGRGNGTSWTDHNMFTAGSDAIWLAAIGPDTPAEGVIQAPGQLYQKQLAQTIAHLVGYDFYTKHDVAAPVSTVFQLAIPADQRVSGTSNK